MSDIFGGLLMSPAVNMGLGILAGNRGPNAFQNALAGGLLAGQNALQSQQLMAMRQMQMKKAEREQAEMERQAQARAQLAQLFPGVPEAALTDAFVGKAMERAYLPPEPPSDARMAQWWMTASPEEKAAYQEQLRVEGMLRPRGSSVSVQNVMPAPQLGVRRLTEDEAMAVGVNPKEPWVVDPKGDVKRLAQTKPEDAGRQAMISSAYRVIDPVRQSLFPKGTKEDPYAGPVDRSTVFSMYGGLPFSEGRQRGQELEEAVQAKLRLETGAAANIGEVKSIIKRYEPHPLDSDDAIRSKLKRLDQFFSSSLESTDPALYRDLKSRAGQGGPTPQGPWSKY